MVYIPFENYKKIGGPATFMRNLRNYLFEENFPIASSIESSNTIFFAVDYDINQLHNFKSKSRKIIQRLDGIFYSPEHSEEQLKFNNVIKDIYCNLADFVIFQSDYSKKQCFEKFSERSKDSYSIIINGVDKKIFFADKDYRKKDDTFEFITTGNFRRREMITPIIQALDEIKDQYKFRFTVIGPCVDELKPYLDRDYVNYVGQQTLESIANYLRNSDIFLFSFLNPACPNSVIEAISTGLPIVGFNSGSMPELLSFNKDLLAYVSDEVFQKIEDFNYSSFKDKIILCIKNFDHYKNIALNNSYLYSFEECGAEYMKVISEVELMNKNRFKEKIKQLKTIFKLKK